MLPIPVTLLGVGLASPGGWLGIGLVIALQLSLVATLVRTADHPIPSRPAPLRPVAQSQTPDGSVPVDTDRSLERPET